MKLLTFTTLYPNALQSSHGVFVENRLTHLLASGQVSTTVVAPIVYVPPLPGLPERYSRLRRIPDAEIRSGIQVRHPRYILLPKVSMSAAPLSLYIAARRCISALVRDGGDFDLIDAHYFYPDGVAAILLGRHFNKPVTITARGSDINILTRYALPLRMIRWAATEADGVIAVCQALKDSLVRLGAASEKIRVLRNGVDLTTFHPGDRARARERLAFRQTVLLSVGNLIPLKGHDLAIQALPHVEGAYLVIVGDGPERANLAALAERTGVADRVRFMGRLPHQALPELYQAADLLLLLSSNEGMANVLLEAMACGTPVVATNVGGTPEVVATPAVGELADSRNIIPIAEAIGRILARRPDRAAVRAYAEGFSWDETTNGQLQLFEQILRARPPRQPRSQTSAAGKELK